jgi:hypothetical protein
MNHVSCACLVWLGEIHLTRLAESSFCFQAVWLEVHACSISDEVEKDLSNSCRTLSSAHEESSVWIIVVHLCMTWTALLRTVKLSKTLCAQSWVRCWVGSLNCCHSKLAHQFLAASGGQTPPVIVSQALYREFRCTGSRQFSKPVERHSKFLSLILERHGSHFR